MAALSSPWAATQTSTCANSVLSCTRIVLIVKVPMTPIKTFNANVEHVFACYLLAVVKADMKRQLYYNARYVSRVCHAKDNTRPRGSCEASSSSSSYSYSPIRCTTLRSKREEGIEFLRAKYTTKSTSTGSNRRIRCLKRPSKGSIDSTYGF